MIFPSPDDICSCGVARNRIINGNIASPHNYRFHVGLVWVNRTKPFCGGTLISTRFVLTAAHCLIGKPAARVRVVVGEHNHVLTGKIRQKMGIIKTTIMTLSPFYDKEEFFTWFLCTSSYLNNLNCRSQATYMCGPRARRSPPLI